LAHQQATTLSLPHERRVVIEYQNDLVGSHLGLAIHHSRRTNIQPLRKAVISLNDAQVLGQAFVNSQASFFNQTYASLTDSQFINALYVNIGGNAGDSGGVTYWYRATKRMRTRAGSMTG
jgi:NRPS condensation-like uncharacterized protein